MIEICNFYGCEEPVCESDKTYEDPHTLRFCQKHSDEFASYVTSGNVPKMLSFWVKSHGGAERMAKEL